MMDREPDFSVRLGAPGAGYSDSELDRRKGTIRSLLTKVLSVASSLRYSFLEEETAAEDSEILVKYYLIESLQKEFNFGDIPGEQPQRVNQDAGLESVEADLHRIKEAAWNTRITLSELAEVLTAHVSGTAPHEQTIGNDAVQLIQGLRRRGNSGLAVRFRDEEIRFQLPLFPAYCADAKERIIMARVKSISRMSAKIDCLGELTSECEKEGEHANNLPRAGKYLLLRPQVQTTSLGLALQVAMDRGAVVNLRVRVAMDSLTMEIRHLELCDIVDRAQWENIAKRQLNHDAGCESLNLNEMRSNSN